jgi:dihydroorotase
VFIQAEDHHLRNQGVVNEGPISTRLGLPPIPETAETVGVSTALLLVEQTGVTAHFCRLSTAKGVAMVARAKQAGLPVSADAGICHLYLTEQDVDGYNADCHINPPLRRLEDREALLQGLTSGAIDAVCSDHTPLNDDAKTVPFSQTLPGASTIEALLPLMLDLVTKGILTPAQVIEKLSTNPARILGLPAGSLQEGSPADVIVVDPGLAWTLNRSQLRSAGRNTPFDGWEMAGRVTHTILNGRIVYPD